MSDLLKGQDGVFEVKGQAGDGDDIVRKRGGSVRLKQVD